MKQFRTTHFYVTDDGKVFNSRLNRWTPQRFCSKRNGTGYKMVTISGLDKKDFMVHRMVAELYIPNPENKPWVNHIDGNKENNHFSNLEWVTEKENSKHARQNGLMCDMNGELCKRAILKNEDVLEIRRLYKEGISQKEIATKYSVRPNQISRIVNNKRWKHLK